MIRRIVAVATVLAGLTLAGCYTPSQADLEAEADRLSTMSAGAVAQIEANVTAVAAACGTSASFATGTVVVAGGASDAQLACVRQRYPNARRAGQ